jgi:hypothetical protein
MMLYPKTPCLANHLFAGTAGTAKPSACNQQLKLSHACKHQMPCSLPLLGLRLCCASAVTCSGRSSCGGPPRRPTTNDCSCGLLRPPVALQVTSRPFNLGRFAAKSARQLFWLLRLCSMSLLLRVLHAMFLVDR